MRNSVIALLLAAGLLSVSPASAVELGWIYKGWAQWHPQLGESSIAGVGTQCYFCKGEGPKDSDGDGVTDDKDQCPNTPKGEAVDAKGCPPPKARGVAAPMTPSCPQAMNGAKSDSQGCLVLESVHFDTGKHNLKPQARKILDQVVKYMNEDMQMRVRLSGHTDNKGSAGLNDPLSARRASSVAQYLESKGINTSRISTEHHGFNQPAADNGTSSGRAMNRRTDLKAVY